MKRCRETDLPLYGLDPWGMEHVSFTSLNSSHNLYKILKYQIQYQF